MNYVGSAGIGYDEEAKKLMIQLGEAVVEFKGVTTEMFAELCAAFAHFHKKLRSKDDLIEYRSPYIIRV